MDEDRLRRLRWLCRRGMKELDVMLERFVEAESANLGKGAWPELEALLSSEDDALWDWLQDPADPAARRYWPLLERIRRGTEVRH